MKKISGRITAKSNPAWHILYEAALFETDRDRILQQIDLAEKAVMARIKELFAVNSDHIDEDLVLDDALYVLRALRNCVAPQSNVA